MKKDTNQFKHKKITVMGLGLLGGLSNDIEYLAKQGASIVVTDLKTEKELKSSVNKLKKFKNIKFVLGGHKLEDFRNRDMILQPGNVPVDSLYLKEAKKNKIPVYVGESLFLNYAPKVTLVGVTGTRGKSMTTQLIYEILSQSIKDRKVYLGGNVRSVSTLALLSKIKEHDVVVMELDSWALHGLGDIKRSPDIAVFTTFMPDHMNYYKGSMEKYFDDKANIFKHQKKGDTLVVRPDMKSLIPKNIKSRLIVAKSNDVDGYSFLVPGKHQKENLACAVKVAQLFGISDSAIKKSVKNFKGVEGRLQYIKTVAGVKIYNDNNATTPEATTAGLEALGEKKKVILIAGGASKGLDTGGLAKAINKYCKDVVLLGGTGTELLLLENKLKTPYRVVQSLKEGAELASGLAKKGDIVLFSPAFASFGMFVNEYDRNDQFMKIVKKLK
jgi:UDP-N-acetylmuramoylalanine--D-glutamate ligase